MLVEVDGGGKGFAPDQANELIVGGKIPMLTRGLGAGVDIEAAEEAVDALVGEAAFPQDTNLFHEERVCLCGGERGGLGVMIRHLDCAFLLRRQFLPSDYALGVQELYRHSYKTLEWNSAKGRA